MSHPPPHRWSEQEGPEGELLRELRSDPAPGARERVWARRETEPLQATPWLGRALLPAALVLGGAALALFWFGPTPAPTACAGLVAILDGKGATVARRRDQEPASLMARLCPGDQLATADGRALVRAATLKMVAEPHSRARVGTLGAGVAVTVDAGRVVFRAARRAADEALSITAGPYRVTVLGTVFHVTRHGQADIAVGVVRGRVLVTGPGTRRILAAGESFDSRGAPDVPIARRALVMLGVGDEPPVTQESASAAANAPDTLETPVVAAPLVTQPPPPGAPTSRQRPMPAAVRPTPPQASAPNADSVTPPPAPEDPSAVAEGFYQAALDSRDDREAVALFDRAASTAAAWREVAAYRAARRAALYDSGEATRRLRALIGDHPRGTFVIEARLSLIELLIAAGEPQAAATAIAAFLQAHPASPRGSELRFLRAEIARQGGRHHEALADYAAAVASERYADEAIFWQAWCLHATGDGAAAQQLFERYLSEFPEGRRATDARDALGLTK